SERKLARAEGAGADALILDLEDSVPAEGKGAARGLAAEYLRGYRGERRARLWVRINPLDSGLAEDDLADIADARPDGIMLPKAEGPADVARLDEKLDAIGADEAIAILPIVTETAAAPFRLGGFADVALPRLSGLTWGAEDLAAAIGASGNRWPDGSWHESFRLVRSLTLLAARAAGVEPIETLHADFRDLEGLAAASRRARAEGFTGRLAIHPDQVAVINEAFRPDEAEIAHARRVVEAFAASGGAGAVGLDGQMLDRPHLKQAEALLAAAALFTRP
ncbi:MAG TPA: CoA ester lyase, partial [Sphingomonas sp.]|nr:CoA ester lyase [Sphingomonas sp.]